MEMYMMKGNDVDDENDEYDVCVFVCECVCVCVFVGSFRADKFLIVAGFVAYKHGQFIKHTEHAMRKGVTLWRHAMVAKCGIGTKPALS